MPQRRNPTSGSFNDQFERLLESLAGSPMAELGKPVCDEADVPVVELKPRIGRCYALHNRYLLDALAWADKSRR
jgi:hypothetical protein